MAIEDGRGRVSFMNPIRSNLAIDERAVVDGDADLDEESQRILKERAAASEEAERRGELIAFDDLLEEVDQILYAPSAG